MTIKQLGGIFGRNPTFNDVTIEGQLTFDGDIDINSDLTVDGTVTTNGLTTTADINFGDNDKAVFGAGDDLEIYSDGSTSYIREAGPGNLRITGAGVQITDPSFNKYFLGSGDVTRLYHSDDEKLATSATGITVTGTVSETSDRNEKQDIETLSDAEQRVAVAANGLLRRLRYRADVEERGDSAEIYFGIIAQDLQSAFEAEGLDANQYGVVSSTTWIDEETGEEHSRLGVHYSGLLAFIISAI